jgi:hypothetical protein
VELVELDWHPLWVTHLGCILGCAEFLGSDVSAPWLFGITGHGFIMNIHQELCPSGPTAWRCETVPELCRNAGLQIERVSSHTSRPDFAEKQTQAWDAVREAIDGGYPCYGWELADPEFYVIYGYDDVGYYFCGPLVEEGDGPKPWQELADTGIGWLEVGVVSLCDPASDADAVRQGLEFALAFADPATKADYSSYATGLAAYDLWISALGNGKADGFGTAYNAEVWSECRRMAVAFLKEARQRLGAKYAQHCDEAISAYTEVSAHMDAVAELFPFTDVPEEEKQANVRDAERCAQAISHLKAARIAEQRGMAALRQLVNALTP